MYRSRRCRCCRTIGSIAKSVRSPRGTVGATQSNARREHQRVRAPPGHESSDGMGSSFGANQREDQRGRSATMRHEPALRSSSGRHDHRRKRENIVCARAANLLQRRALMTRTLSLYLSFVAVTRAALTTPHHSFNKNSISWSVISHTSTLKSALA